MHENEISEKTIGAAIQVHRILGPGLLESVYEDALAYELKSRGISYRRQASLPISYKGLLIRNAFRIDLVVEKHVIVELKAVDTVMPVHKKQLLTYLKLSRYRLGLLINFNSATFKSGITRLVNGL